VGYLPITDGSGSVVYTPELRIDLQTLSDVALVLRSEVANSLEAQAAQLFHAFSLGASFGLTTESLNVKATRSYYQACLVQIRKLLETYVTTANTLATTAADIVKQYGDADALAKVRIKDVEAAINGLTESADSVTSVANILAPGNAYIGAR
jgi:hypothetical protein